MRKDRAVSTAVSYTLTLAITAVLITGLLVSGTNFVDDRRGEVVRDEITVIGQQVASDVARADRLVVAADSSGPDLTVGLNQTFPERVTGGAYRVVLEPSDGRVVVEAIDAEMEIAVGLQNRTALQRSTADGGTIRIEYNESAGGGALEVKNG